MAVHVREKHHFNLGMEDWTEAEGFAKIHACLDNIFRDLRATGVGSSTKHAEPFTKKKETHL